MVFIWKKDQTFAKTKSKMYIFRIRYSSALTSCLMSISTASQARKQIFISHWPSIRILSDYEHVFGDATNSKRIIFTSFIFQSDQSSWIFISQVLESDGHRSCSGEGAPLLAMLRPRLSRALLLRGPQRLRSQPRARSLLNSLTSHLRPLR